MVYWEALFQRLHRVELWQPSKQPTLRIGVPASKNPSAKTETPKKAPVSSTRNFNVYILY